MYRTQLHIGITAHVSKKIRGCYVGYSMVKRCKFNVNKFQLRLHYSDVDVNKMSMY